MEKIFVAKRIARKLWSTEAAVDAAMTESAELLADYLKAHQEMKVSTVVADDVQSALLEAMRALSEARTAMVAVHGKLDQARERIGIRTSMGGVIFKPAVLLADEAQPATMREAV